jgi:hypothetical protein
MECIGFDENEDFYARAGKFGCQKCKSKALIYLSLFGVLAFILIYVAVLVTIIIMSSRRDDKNSVLVRIMTNYFQIILLVRNLDV